MRGRRALLRYRVLRERGRARADQYAHGDHYNDADCDAHPGSDADRNAVAHPHAVPDAQCDPVTDTDTDADAVADAVAPADGDRL